MKFLFVVMPVKFEVWVILFLRVPASFLNSGISVSQVQALLGEGGKKKVDLVNKMDSRGQAM